MDRELKKIHLSDKTEVSIVTYLTWAEKEKIQAVMSDGAEVSPNGTTRIADGASFTYKVNAIKQLVKLAVKENKELPINDQWVESLQSEDGDLIWNEIEILLAPKKK